MKQEKKVRKKYDPSRNRKRLEPYILNHSYFYHGSVFQGTSPQYGNSKMDLTPHMAATILSQKQKWSGVVLVFYTDAQNSNQYKMIPFKSDTYITEAELRQQIRDVQKPIIDHVSVENLISTGYFVVPNQVVDLSVIEDDILQLFVAEGAWDTAVMTLATELRKQNG